MDSVPVPKVVGPLTTPQEVKHSLAGDLAKTAVEDDDSLNTSQQIQAYAMLDFDSFTFYVQTMQIILGRMVDGDGGSDSLDIHLGSQKAISRRHAKIFYNFGNQRFELSVLGRNGAFVDDAFVEKGVTVPLHHGSKVQIGETGFIFELPGGDNNNNRKPSGKGNSEMEGPTSISISRKQKKRLPSISEADILAIKSLDSVRATKDLDIDMEIEKVLADHDMDDKDSKFDKDLAMALQENSKSPPPPISLENKKLNKGSSSAVTSTTTKKTTKQKKRVYSLDEIPHQYREKPPLSYSTLITECLRKRSTERGMSLSEIYKAIQDIYPYYFYAADGWQSSVRHNLSLNKSFKKISKEGKGWLWGLNEEVIAEKERQKEKQIETAKAKVKNIQAQQIAKANQKEIDEGKVKPLVSTPTPQQQQQAPPPPIQQQTASTQSNNVNDNTKRALSYLQKELIQLTKNRYNNFDKVTTTEILTQALAMTINQVGQAAKSAGIKGSPLVTLIDKNPQHITKILTAALNAATLQITRKKGLPTPSTAPSVAKKSSPTPTQSNLQPKPIAPKPEIKPSSSPSATTGAIRLQPSKVPNKPMIHTFTKPMQFTKPIGTPMKIKPIKLNDPSKESGSTSIASQPVSAAASSSPVPISNNVSESQSTPVVAETPQITKQEETNNTLPNVVSKPQFYSKGNNRTMKHETQLSKPNDVTTSFQEGSGDTTIDHIKKAPDDLSQMLDSFISDNSSALNEGLKKRPLEDTADVEEPSSKVIKTE